MQNAFLLSEHKRFVQPDLHGKGLEINTLQKGFPSKKMQKMVLTPTHSNPVQCRMRVCIHNETKGAIELDRQNQRLRLDLQTTERERERERAKETERKRETETETETETERIKD